jgi:hypothetical protein
MGRHDSARLVCGFGICSPTNWSKLRLRSLLTFLSFLLPRESAVDPTTLTIRAPEQKSRSRSISPSPPASALETYIGTQVAGAAAALVVALDEARDGGGVTSGTRRQGGELIAEVVKLRNFLVGRYGFEHAAKVHGARVLQEACPDMSAAVAAELVGQILAVVAAVVRAELN